MAGGPELRDRLEQEIESFLGNHLSDENDAAGNPRAVRLPRLVSRRRRVWNRQDLDVVNPVRSKFALGEPGIAHEGIDERRDAVPPQPPIERARIGRVAETRDHADTAHPKQDERGHISQQRLIVWQKHVRRLDPARFAQQMTTDGEHFAHHSCDRDRRQAPAGQRKPVRPSDQLAPAASASGVMRKLSQLFTMQ